MNDQHLVTVCLDIEKAYEMVWRNHIIQVLSNNKVNTLFLVSFNDVNNCFKYSVKSSKFADDITFYCKGKDPKITEKLIQESLNSLQKWSDVTGYKFSTTKSMCIPFAKTRYQDITPTLYINSQELKVVDTIKILGLLFDKHLT